MAPSALVVSILSLLPTAPLALSYENKWVPSLELSSSKISNFTSAPRRFCSRSRENEALFLPTHVHQNRIARLYFRYSSSKIGRNNHDSKETRRIIAAPLPKRQIAGLNDDVVESNRGGVVRSTHDELALEFMVRERASNALVAVFYPTKGQNIEAEKALKKSLRCLEREKFALGVTREEIRTTRKRLADLILGTSVMRLRHWYTMTQRSSEGTDTFASLVNEGIRGVGYCLSSGATLDHHDIEKDTIDGHLFRRRLNTVSKLVDIHAEFLHSKKIHDRLPEKKADTLPITSHDVKWPSSAAQRISVQHSLPFFIVELLIRQYGLAGAEEFAATSNEPGPITLRRNEILCESDDILCARLWNEDRAILSRLDELSRQSKHECIRVGCTAMAEIDESEIDQTVNMDAIPDDKVFGSLIAPIGCLRLTKGGPLADDREKKSIWSLQTWRDGWFEVQDAGSQLIVEATEAVAGDTIIDYCAGNGGKTLALASRLWRSHKESVSHESRSRIVAHDIVDERLRQLQGSLNRVGLRGANATAPAYGVTVETTSNIDQYFQEGNVADVVLVDAPCSSLGVLRRRPSQRWALTQKDVVSYFPNTQLGILRNASRLVKPGGGRLIYATCSIVREENECVALAFENSEKDFHSVWERWPFPRSGPREISCNPSLDELSHFRNIIPHIHDSDGFFIARWRKR